METGGLNKKLITRLDDKGYLIDKDNYKYSLIIEIESIAHKFRPFFLRSLYIINYNYRLFGADHKELLKTKNDQSKVNLNNLIDEVTGDIVDDLIEVAK